MGGGSSGDGVLLALRPGLLTVRLPLAVQLQPLARLLAGILHEFGKRERLLLPAHRLGEIACFGIGDGQGS